MSEGRSPTIPIADRGTSDPPVSLQRLLETSAAKGPGATAIAAPGQGPLSYGRLLLQAQMVHRALRSGGIGRHDRVVLIAPSGPELAVALVTVTASAVCAPLSPHSRAGEFDRYLAQLRPAAVIVQPGVDSPARKSAQELGISILDLTPTRDAAAGLFTLTGGPANASSEDGFSECEDTALVLHTSGTTSRPKLIPLTHANLYSSNGNLITTLALTEGDRHLNMISLHHAMGLRMLLAMLSVGGTVICPSEPNADLLFACLEEFQPTCYSAAPPVHHAVLARAGAHHDVIVRCPLRFIHTGAGVLAPPIMGDLERVFRAPVLNSYGMTETGFIAITLLPPRPRKSGSAGVPAGLEVAVADESGTPLPPGRMGEIIVRGRSVTSGYENDPAANAAAFRDGWFRTGDLGLLDADGFLFLSGRIKDLINRGGTKILPSEVEETLLAHPAVADAAAFPLPHPTLGEDLAAAAVLCAGARATEQDLRQFVITRLADFKIPSRVLIVEAIPKDRHGKVQRQALAGHFGPLLQTSFTAPRGPHEETVTRIWAEELGVDRVGVHETFFELGGDSLRAARVCARLGELMGRSVPVASLFRAPTIAQFVDLLNEPNAGGPPGSPLVPIQVGGERPPLFCLHNAAGHVHQYYPLARHLGPDQPVYGLLPQGADSGRARLEDVAARHVQEIRTCYPSGPYLLCGYSFGGLMAWEVAQQLRAQGRHVALLALLDTVLYINPSLAPESDSALRFLLRRARFHLDALRELPCRGWFAYVSQQVKAHLSGLTGRDPEPPPVDWMPLFDAGVAYLPRAYPGPVTLFLARRERYEQPNFGRPLGSARIPRCDYRLPGKLAAGRVEIHRVPGDHVTFMIAPHVRVPATALRDCIERAVKPPARARLGVRPDLPGRRRTARMGKPWPSTDHNYGAWQAD